MTILSLPIGSYAASINLYQEPKSLLNFTRFQTTTSPKEEKQNLFIADVNSDKEAIKSVLILQFKALNEENIEAYMATIDSNSPVFKPTRELTAQVFSNSDLKYVMNEFDVVNISSNTAKVRVVQTTTKIRAPQFRNNRMVLIHNFKKLNGTWKMFSTEVEKVEFLN
ncbi:hypothetical protein QT971_20870 [Microcoleus sp. herbarium19]|uniref:hypothetical protein n=1 Tax=unclassified Microcoleus TaxID=2642155 RepID=UPI002FD46B7A